MAFYYQGRRHVPQAQTKHFIDNLRKPNTIKLLINEIDHYDKTEHDKYLSQLSN